MIKAFSGARHLLFRRSAFAGLAPMSSLTNTLNITPDSKCVGCSGIGEAMSVGQVEQQRALLIPEWSTTEDCTRLTKSLRVKNFATALDFINKIGQIAEAENHHPDLTIRSYNHVDIALWTHTLGGVTENDLIMAVKIDTIPVTLARK